MSTPRSLKLPHRVRSGTATTERGSFAVLEAQPGHGVSERRPALLVPGYTGSKEDFLPVLEPLAMAGRTVVAMDLRGQYQSPHAPQARGYTPDELAADVLSVAASISPDAGGVHLVGHSMGGLIARHAVLSPAHRILSLAMLGSGPAAVPGERAASLRELLAILDPRAHADKLRTDKLLTDELRTNELRTDELRTNERSSDDPAADLGRIADLDRDHDRGRLSVTIGQLWRDKLEPQARSEGIDQPIIDFLRERTMRTCPVSLVMMARYLLSCPDRTDELAALAGPPAPGQPARLPLMVIYGENDDAWPPKVQDRMAKRLAAERSCIPGAAHSPAVEAPDTTARALTTFWNAAERRRPAPGKSD